MNNSEYTFWLNDLSVLYKDDNYYKFYPTIKMNRVQQLNALTRLFIYMIILFVLFGNIDNIYNNGENQNDNDNDYKINNLIYVPIIGIIFVIIMYNVFETDDEGKKAEILRLKRQIKSPVFTEPDVNYRTYTVDIDGETKVIDIDEEYEKNNNVENFDTKYELQSGQYDSNGDFNYGNNYDALATNKEEKIKYTLDEMRLYEKNKCRRPTKDNPFMNPSIVDFNSTSGQIMACNANDEDIDNNIDNMQSETRLKFNEDMYRNLDDVFDRKNSQRQFYTVAHNVPNDQDAFAKWCYKMPSNCKTNQTKCLKYQDLRTKY